MRKTIHTQPMCTRTCTYSMFILYLYAHFTATVELFVCRPPGMAASIKSDGAFLIPADMSQFQIARFVSSEERRAAKVREVHERLMN